MQEDEELDSKLQKKRKQRSILVEMREVADEESYKIVDAMEGILRTQ